MRKKLKKFYNGKKVLITGVTGFKGTWLCSWLLELGAKITGLGYNPNLNKNLFYKLKLNNKINLKLFDIRDISKLNSLVKKTKPSIIFHLAAQPLIYESYKKPLETFDINSRGTLNILEVTRLNKFIKSVVIVTSDKCYENNYSTKGFKENDRLGGIDPYSASKASAEIAVKAYRESFFSKKNIVGISTGRAGNVIGGGDWSPKRLIPDSIKFLRKNKSIYLRNPNFNRPWQFVLEPIKGYLLLGLKQFYNPKKYSGAWNFGTERNSVTSVKKIVEYIIDFWGSGKLKINKRKKFYEQENLQLNIQKSKRILNWKPTYNIKQSVYVTVDWYNQVLNNKKSPIDITNEQINRYMDESK